MKTRNLMLALLAFSFPIPLFAQEAPSTEKEAPPVEKEEAAAPSARPGKAKNRAAGIFLRAFYLQYGEKKPERAEKLYREYLEKAGPSGRYAARAARELAEILERRGRKEEAQALRRRFPPLPSPEKARAKRGGAGASPSRDAWIERTKRILQNLKERLSRMEERGADERVVEGLRERIDRMEALLKRVEAGEIPPPRRGRGGFGGRRFDLSRMDPERREALLERILENARKAARKAEENGQEETARKILEDCSRLEERIKEGKWEEAGRILREMRSRVGRRGRGRRGNSPIR